LRKRGITQLYFRRQDLEKVIAYLNSTLLLLENESPGSTRKKMMVFFEHVNLTLRRVMAFPGSGPHLKQANWQVDWLMKQLGKGLLPYHSLWELLLNDYSLYNHALNVFLLSTAFMVFLEKEYSACRAVGHRRTLP